MSKKLSKEDCFYRVAKEKGYPSWGDYYDFVAREGQRPEVVAQLIEAGTIEAMEMFANQKDEDKSIMHKFDSTLTKEELELPGYLEWSNETLGRSVKAMAKQLFETEVTGFAAIKTMASVYALIHSAMETNAGSLKQTVEGFTSKKYPDAAQKWEIIVRQLKK